MGVCHSTPKNPSHSQISHHIITSNSKYSLKKSSSEITILTNDLNKPTRQAPEPPVTYNIYDQEFYINIKNGKKLINLYDYENGIPLYEKAVKLAKNEIKNIKNKNIINDWEIIILEWEGIIIELKLEYRKLLQRKEFRRSAVNELINTEAIYVNDIRLIINEYADPLVNNDKYKNVLNKLEYQTLFGLINNLVETNERFLIDLKNNIINEEIGKEFLQTIPYLKDYERYMNNYCKIIEYLLPNLIKKNIKFNNYLNEINIKLNGKPLEMLLILPIQRMFKYELCLKEIIKYTEVYHKDYNNLKDAFNLIELTTKILNNKMEEHESRMKIMQIEKQFHNKIKLIEQNRYFIKMGKLIRIHKSGKEEQLYFILFNDCIITANGKNENKLKFKHKYIIDSSFSVKDSGFLYRDKIKKKFTNTMFEIHTSEKSFYCVSENENEKENWFKILKNLINNIKNENELNYSKPLKTPITWVNICEIKKCNQQFNMINHKHHCNSCGKIVCNKHFKNKMEDKFNNNDMVNVCDDCYELIQLI